MPNVGVVAGDKDVDLLKIISINVSNRKFSDYLLHIEELTGYEVKYNDGIVFVRSISQRQWNLAAISENVRKVSSSSGKW